MANYMMDQDLRTIEEVYSRFQQEIRTNYRTRPILDHPQKVYELLKLFMSHLEHEEMWVVVIDESGRGVSFTRLYTGTRTTAPVSMNEAFREAVILGGHAVVFAHNHVNGNTNPSESDIKTAKALIRAGYTLNIVVLDNMVIGHDGWQSIHDHIAADKKKGGALDDLFSMLSKMED